MSSLFRRQLPGYSALARVADAWVLRETLSALFAVTLLPLVPAPFPYILPVWVTELCSA